MARPAKSDSEKFRTPARQIGRIADAEWNEIQEAAKASGKSLTRWATEILLKAARRLNRTAPTR